MRALHFHWISTRLAGIAVVAAAAASPAPAGVVGKPFGAIVRVCFVGNAVAKKPEDVAWVWQNLREFEKHGNVKFVPFGAKGRCPPPTLSSDRRFEIHDGDLRIALPGTLDYDGRTPLLRPQLGRGCADPQVAAWGSNFPENRDKPEFRACRYTTYLGREMGQGAVLHELAHAVGMFHEHERTDIPRSDPLVERCFHLLSWFGRNIAPGQNWAIHVTPYDRHSITHYPTRERNKPETHACTLVDFEGNARLSYFDKLTIRIMYPHSSVAEIRGPRVVTVGQRLVLQNEWGALGALVEHVVKKPYWAVSRAGQHVYDARGADFRFTFDAAGIYDVHYTFEDAIGRKFENRFTIAVLPSERYHRLHATTTAARFALF